MHLIPNTRNNFLNCSDFIKKGKKKKSCTKEAIQRGKEWKEVLCGIQIDSIIIVIIIIMVLYVSYGT
jgi:hypothetical protein